MPKNKKKISLSNKTLKMGLAGIMVAGITTGVVLGTISSANSSKAPKYVGPQTMDNSFPGAQFNDADSMLANAYYTDSTGGLIATRKDKDFQKKIDEYQRINKVPVVFVYKFGGTLFKDNYLDVINEQEFIEYIQWFAKNTMWGPDIATLDNFSIVRGTSKEGGMVTLGGHSGTKDGYDIKFYPDSFYGMAKVFSTDYSDRGHTLLNKLNLKQLYGVADSVLTSFEKELGLSELKLRGYNPQVQSLYQWSEGDEIVNSVLKNVDKKYIEGLFKLLDPEKDSYYQQMVAKRDYNPDTHKFGKDFYKHFIKYIYATWYMQQTNSGNTKARIEPQFREDIPQSALPFMRQVAEKLGVKVYDENFTKTDIEGMRTYEVYYEVYPKLLDKLGKTLPDLVTRDTDNHNRLSLSAQIPLLYLKNYKWNEKLNDYEMIADKDKRYNPGIGWLKYVSQHEYGHHLTLQYTKDTSEPHSSTYTSNFVTSQTSPGRGYGKDDLQRLIWATRNVDRGSTIDQATGDRQYQPDQLNPQGAAKYDPTSSVKILGTGSDPIYNGIHHEQEWPTQEELWGPDKSLLKDPNGQQFVGYEIDPKNLFKHIRIDETSDKVYFSKAELTTDYNDITGLDLSHGWEDLTEFFYNPAIGKMKEYQISFEDFAKYLKDPSTTVPTGFTERFMLALAVKGGLGVYNNEETLRRSFDAKTATLNPTIVLGKFNGNIFEAEYHLQLMQPDGTLADGAATTGMQTDWNGWDSTGARDYHAYIHKMIGKATDQFKTYGDSPFFETNGTGKYAFSFNGSTYVSTGFGGPAGSIQFTVGQLVSRYEETFQVKLDPTNVQQIADFVSYMKGTPNDDPSSASYRPQLIAKVVNYGPLDTTPIDKRDKPLTWYPAGDPNYNYMNNVIVKISDAYRRFGVYLDPTNLANAWVRQFSKFAQDGTALTDDEIRDPSTPRLEPTNNIEILLLVLSQGGITIEEGNKVAEAIAEQGGYSQTSQLYSDYGITPEETMTRSLSELGYAPSHGAGFELNRNPSDIDGDPEAAARTEYNSGLSLFFKPIIAPEMQFDYKVGKFTRTFEALGGFGSIEHGTLASPGFYKDDSAKQRVHGQPGSDEIHTFSYYSTLADGTTPLDNPGYFEKQPTSKSEKPAYIASKTDFSGFDVNNKVRVETSENLYVYWNYFDKYYDVDKKTWKDLSHVGFYQTTPLDDSGQQRLDLTSLKDHAQIMAFPAHDVDLTVQRATMVTGTSAINAGYVQGDTITFQGRTYHYYTNTQKATGAQELETPGLFKLQPQDGMDFLNPVTIDDIRDFFTDGVLYHDGKTNQDYHWMTYAQAPGGNKVPLPLSQKGFYITRPTQVEGAKPTEFKITSPGSYLEIAKDTQYYITAEDDSILPRPGFFNSRPKSITGDKSTLMPAIPYMSKLKEGDKVTIGGTEYTYKTQIELGGIVTKLQFPGLFASVPTKANQRPDYVDDSMGLMAPKANGYKYYDKAANGEELFRLVDRDDAIDKDAPEVDGSDMRGWYLHQPATRAQAHTNGEIKFYSYYALDKSGNKIQPTKDTALHDGKAGWYFTATPPKQGDTNPKAFGSDYAHFDALAGTHAEMYLYYFDTALNGDDLEGLAGYYHRQPSSHAEAHNSEAAGGLGGPLLVRPSKVRMSQEEWQDSQKLHTGIYKPQKGDFIKIQGQNYVWATSDQGFTIDDVDLVHPGWFSEGDSPSLLSIPAIGASESVLREGTVVKDGTDQYMYMGASSVAGATGWYKIVETGGKLAFPGIPNLAHLRIDQNVVKSFTEDQLKGDGTPKSGKTLSLDFVSAYGQAIAAKMKADGTKTISDADAKVILAAVIAKGADWTHWVQKISAEYEGYIRVDDSLSPSKYTSIKPGDAGVHNAYKDIIGFDTLGYKAETAHIVTRYQYFGHTTGTTTAGRLVNPGWYISQPQAFSKTSAYPDLGSNFNPYISGTILHLVDDPHRSAKMQGDFYYHDTYFESHIKPKTTESGWYSDLEFRMASQFPMYNAPDADDARARQAAAAATDATREAGDIYEQYGLSQYGKDYLQFLRDIQGIGHSDISGIWRKEASDQLFMWGFVKIPKNPDGTVNQDKQIKYLVLRKGDEVHRILVHDDGDESHLQYHRYLGKANPMASDLDKEGTDQDKDQDKYIGSLTDTDGKPGDEYEAWTSDYFVPGGYSNAIIGDGDWELSFELADGTRQEMSMGVDENGQQWRTRYNENGKQSQLATSFVEVKPESSGYKFIYHIKPRF